MRYLFILLIAVLTIDCSPKLSPDAGWGQQNWVLVEMKGVPVQQSGGRRDAHLRFEVREKKFSGNGGCNQLSGNYTIDKSDIRFSEVISTKMSCVDIDFENTFLSILNNIDRYEQRDNQLLLKRKREILLVFRPQ